MYAQNMPNPNAAQIVVNGLNTVDPDGVYSLEQATNKFGAVGIRFIRDRKTNTKYRVGDNPTHVIVGGIRRPDDHKFVRRPVFNGIPIDGKGLPPLVSSHYLFGERDCTIVVPSHHNHPSKDTSVLSTMIKRGVNCIQSCLELTPKELNEVVQRLGMIGFNGDQDTAIQLCWWYLICRDKNGDHIKTDLSPNHVYGINLSNFGELRRWVRDPRMDRASCLWTLVTGINSPAVYYGEIEGLSYRPDVVMAMSRYLYHQYNIENLTISPLRLIERGDAPLEAEAALRELVRGTRTVHNLADSLGMHLPDDVDDAETYFLENIGAHTGQ